MQVIRTIYEQDADQSAPRDHFRQRDAARAVVTDSEGCIALLYVSKEKYHKLPGGGLEEDDDDMSAALRREMLEEIGCNVQVTGELGIVTEYRDEWEMRQDSHCYAARVVGEKGQPDFTAEELADGFEVVWTEDIAAAIAKLEADSPTNYEGPLILRRDLAVLRAALAHS